MSTFSCSALVNCSYNDHKYFCNFIEKNLIKVCGDLIRLGMVPLCCSQVFSRLLSENVTNSITDQNDEDFTFLCLADEVRTTDLASMRSYLNSKGRAFN